MIAIHTQYLTLIPAEVADAGGRNAKAIDDRATALLKWNAAQRAD
jgi:hypothetical protein